MKTKVCSKCKAEKTVGEFYKYKSAKDGLQPSCKSCHNALMAKWRKNNPKKANANTYRWQKNNPEKVNAYVRKWQKNNPEKIRASRRNWRKNNPGKKRKQDIKIRLKRYHGLTEYQITPDLIEVKYLEGELKRKIKQKQKELCNQ